MILEKQPNAFVIAVKGHSVSESQLKDCFKSAKKFNWNIEVFWGIDGRKITEDYWKKEGIFPRLDKPTMSRSGVQGCFLSHWSLWKKCSELNKPIIVLEHDAVIKNFWKPLTIDKNLIKLHRQYSRKQIYIDEDSGRWTKSGHAYCLLPVHANILIQFVKKVGAFEADRIIGDKVIGYEHLGNPSLIERQNQFSTTKNLD